MSFVIKYPVTVVVCCFVCYVVIMSHNEEIDLSLNNFYMHITIFNFYASRRSPIEPRQFISKITYVRIFVLALKFQLIPILSVRLDQTSGAF